MSRSFSSPIPPNSESVTVSFLGGNSFNLFYEWSEDLDPDGLIASCAWSNSMLKALDIALTWLV
ncbi:hypothetical protein K9N68_37325 (plasmid) [Kovacikia minuta CCNUW1]|uniref:hypothetical protein n=1 Tax=Kovacikia minuta TaxID=2931930 RepID=UPI001CCF251D|nr:hypothetical protein [Kovacikia minuta]UBF29875.1 hypothetical protein K9N68_37325 [Kovacikia minuta CCNUW1]